MLGGVHGCVDVFCDVIFVLFCQYLVMIHDISRACISLLEGKNGIELPSPVNHGKT